MERASFFESNIIKLNMDKWLNIWKYFQKISDEMVFIRLEDLQDMKVEHVCSSFWGAA